LKREPNCVNPVKTLNVKAQIDILALSYFYPLEFGFERKDDS
jgi:hypothetical protein